MSNQNNNLSFKARVIHRYLGYFLAGIMTVYALSGITMIFRKTSTFKKEVIVEKQLNRNLKKEQINPKLKLGGFEKVEDGLYYFEHGDYNPITGIANIKKFEPPFILKKMEKLHKASTNSPLYFLNIFFAGSLLFFVISSFWMYAPKIPVFKKGMYFVSAGVFFALVLIFV